jgi:hypothetical protein
VGSTTMWSFAMYAETQYSCADRFLFFEDFPTADAKRFLEDNKSFFCEPLVPCCHVFSWGCLLFWAHLPVYPLPRRYLILWRKSIASLLSHYWSLFPPFLLEWMRRERRTTHCRLLCFSNCQEKGTFAFVHHGSQGGFGNFFAKFQVLCLSVQ